MATTVVKTIGSAGGRDYSTIQAWEDAAPANLVTSDQIWRGECYNDSEFAPAGTVVTISGSTTDATRYIELTAAAGQSFQDQAGVRSNALTYNTALGVCLRSTSTYVNAVSITVDYAKVSRLQFKGSHMGFISFSGSGTMTAKDCLGLSTNPGSVDLFTVTGGTGNFYNCLAIVDSTSDPLHSAFFTGATGVFEGCTAIRTKNNSASGNGFRASYAAVTMKSCASFGFSTSYSRGTGVSEVSIINNGSDQATWTGGSSSQLSITYTSTSPFTQGNATSNDCRTVTGTNLSANGLLDSTNAPNDISATARAASPTIGHWELASASDPAVPGKYIFPGIGF